MHVAGSTFRFLIFVLNKTLQELQALSDGNIENLTSSRDIQEVDGLSSFRNTLWKSNRVTGWGR
jgi:hypothetical protein